MNRTVMHRLAAVVAAFLTIPSFTVTALQPGDIAIIGFDGKTTDSFAFMNLVPLDAGVTVTFTLTNNGSVAWSSPGGGLPAGTATA